MDTFKIGRLGKTHGVKGELTFHFTDDVFDRTDAEYVFVEIDGLQVPFFFEEYRFRSEQTALVKFEGVDDANRAATMVGCDVFFPRERCDDNDGELSWAEIIGFTITDADYADFKKMVKDSDFKYDRQSEKRLADLKKIAEFEGYYEDAKPEFEALEKKFAHNLDREMDRKEDDLRKVMANEIVRR